MLHQKKIFHIFVNLGEEKFLDVLDSNESAEKIMARYRQFTANNKFLDTRVALITEGLRSVGIGCEQLI